MKTTVLHCMCYFYFFISAYIEVQVSTLWSKPSNIMFGILSSICYKPRFSFIRSCIFFFWINTSTPPSTSYSLQHLFQFSATSNYSVFLNYLIDFHIERIMRNIFYTILSFLCKLIWFYEYLHYFCMHCCFFFRSLDVKTIRLHEHFVLTVVFQSLFGLVVSYMHVFFLLKVHSRISSF